MAEFDHDNFGSFDRALERLLRQADALIEQDKQLPVDLVADLEDMGVFFGTFNIQENKS